MRPQYLIAVGLAALLPATGCESPITVAGQAQSAQFDFMNGPADLPNVFRGDSVLLFVWADVASDLVIVVNAPSGGVHALRRCGGSLTPEPQPVQTVGEMQDVLRQVRLLRDVNIHLYSPVPVPFRNFMAHSFRPGDGRSDIHRQRSARHGQRCERLWISRAGHSGSSERRQRTGDRGKRATDRA